MGTLSLLRAAQTSALVIASAVVIGAQTPAPVPAAEQATVPPPSTLVQGANVVLPSAARISLTAGRSLVLTTTFEITRIALNNPAIADATVVAPTEVLIDGKAAGTITLIVWGHTQRIQYDVVVDRGVSELQQQLHLIFPGEDLQATQTADAVFLTGRASTNYVMLRAGEVAEAMSPKSRVMNMIQLPGGEGSQQVMLQVRIAEVSRRAIQELGANFFTGTAGVKDTIVRPTTGQFPAVRYDNFSRTESDGVVSSTGEMTFSDFLNLFVFSNKYNVGALVTALRTAGYFQSLAEPNLIAYNGQEASFLAGGELPIPTVQGNAGGGGGVSVTYKEFGIRLTFRPTIAGDVIRLRVSPEVSSLDFANGVSIAGFRIPSLISRKASTEVELRDGQSFAIAGLMNNTSQESRQWLPFLSDIPLIGKLFKSKAGNQERTELMVLVTPRLVRPLNPDDLPPLPTMDNRFIQGDTMDAKAPAANAPAGR